MRQALIITAALLFLGLQSAQATPRPLTAGEESGQRAERAVATGRQDLDGAPQGVDNSHLGYAAAFSWNGDEGRMSTSALGSRWQEAYAVAALERTAARVSPTTDIPPSGGGRRGRTASADRVLSLALGGPDGTGVPSLSPSGSLLILAMGVVGLITLRRKEP